MSLLHTKLREQPKESVLAKWDELNKLWYNIYLCEDFDIINAQMHALIEIAKLEKDDRFVQKLIELKKKLKNTKVQDKLSWHTSKVGTKFYPPVDTEDASPVPWSKEQSKIDLGNSIRAQAKYTRKTKLAPNNNINGIEQNPDINNCSFVASMINIRKHNINMPQIIELPNNYYHVNLSFNGSSKRLVTVDANCIPTTENNDEQLSIYSDNFEDKIIELAYLQLKCGSYSTSGSNVTIDTYRLTGFLPEIVPVTFYDFDNLYKYFKSNICLMGLGTHEDKNKLKKSILTNHDYSITDFDTINRKIILQDPLNSSLNLKIDMNELSENFTQLYINWDSSKLFNNCKTLTFYYDIGKCNTYNNNIDKPLFLIENNSNTTELVWILLESHITSQDINEEKHISYLRKISHEKVYDELYLPSDSASNIGLQLLKLELKPHEKNIFLCYSNLSKCFTLHLYSILPNIKLTQCKKGTIAKSVEFTELVSSMKTSYGSTYYFQNPTFQIEIPSIKEREIFLNVLLSSKDEQSLLNYQIFESTDYLLQKPILFDNKYTLQNYPKFQIPILTNRKYNIICSCHDSVKELNDFKLIATFTDRDKNENLNKKCKKDTSLINLDRTNLIFNGLLYQETEKFIFPAHTTRLKIVVNNDKNNSIFIRCTIDDINNEYDGAEIRCNIFEKDTHNNLFFDDNFYKRVLVIPDFKIKENKIPVLLLELNKKVDYDVPIKVFIGSTKKIEIKTTENGT